MTGEVIGDPTGGPGLADRISALVERLYPGESDEVCRRLVRLADEYASRMPGRTITPPTHRTACLITYGDGIRRPGETPLRTLAGFLHDRVGDVVSDVHLLPMFPWTSDDGFAVVDHREVNPALGTWADVADLADEHDLMFDFVANHTSSSSPWFQAWLAREPPYAHSYLERAPDFDVSHVTRPRTTPLFHAYQRPDGTEAWAWTTFGEDQVDVDLRHPDTLLELSDVLLGYLARGAAAIRLDAIGFLWKESGTTCIHLPQTHAVIKLWRVLADHVAPGARLLTETNVPHEENISYFGNGQDEAHLVYQFALPPLVLHSFVAGSTRRLSDWAKGVGRVSTTATWFNFLASHDGIGLRATEGILDDAERAALVARTRAHGGRVSMASRPDGTRSVYELNLSYLDALCTPDEARDPATGAMKGLAAHSILFAFLGVPAVYYHSLVGSTPDHDGMVTSRINRRINREVLDADRLVHDLDHDPRRRAVFGGMRHLLDVRRRHEAFSPFGTQQVEYLDDRVFAVRRAAGTRHELLCVTNVSGDSVRVPDVAGHDVLTGTDVAALTLGPWGYAWLRPPTGPQAAPR
ncbi:MAG: alpha-amylase family glycosyl hydrolase [Nocardioides sp.]